MSKTLMLSAAAGLMAMATTFASTAEAGYGHKVHYAYNHHYAYKPHFVYKPYFVHSYKYVPTCYKYAWVYEHGHKKLVCVW